MGIVLCISNALYYIELPLTAALHSPSLAFGHCNKGPKTAAGIIIILSTVNRKYGVHGVEDSRISRRNGRGEYIIFE